MRLKQIKCSKDNDYIFFKLFRYDEKRKIKSHSVDGRWNTYGYWTFFALFFVKETKTENDHVTAVFFNL